GPGRPLLGDRRDRGGRPHGGGHRYRNRRGGRGPRTGHRGTDLLPRGLHLAQHGGGVGRPGGGVAPGGAGDEGVERRRQPGDELRRRRDVLVDVPPRDVHGPVVLVRHPTGEHLEQHDAGGVHVGTRIGLAGGDQFRGDVGGGGEQVPAAVGGRRLDG